MRAFGDCCLIMFIRDESTRNRRERGVGWMKKNGIVIFYICIILFSTSNQLWVIGTSMSKVEASVSDSVTWVKALSDFDDFNATTPYSTVSGRGTVTYIVQGGDRMLNISCPDQATDTAYVGYTLWYSTKGTTEFAYKYIIEFKIKLTKMPTSSTYGFGFRIGGTEHPRVEMFIRNNGTIRLQNSTTNYVSTNAMSVNNWHVIELELNRTSGYVGLKVNGTTWLNQYFSNFKNWSSTPNLNYSIFWQLGAWHPNKMDGTALLSYIKRWTWHPVRTPSKPTYVAWYVPMGRSEALWDGIRLIQVHEQLLPQFRGKFSVCLAKEFINNSTLTNYLKALSDYKYGVWDFFSYSGEIDSFVNTFFSLFNYYPYYMGSYTSSERALYLYEKYGVKGGLVEACDLSQRNEFYDRPYFLSKIAYHLPSSNTSLRTNFVASAELIRARAHTHRRLSGFTAPSSKHVDNNNIWTGQLLLFEAINNTKYNDFGWWNIVTGTWIDWGMRNQMERRQLINASLMSVRLLLDNYPELKITPVRMDTFADWFNAQYNKSPFYVYQSQDVWYPTVERLIMIQNDYYQAVLAYNSTSFAIIEFEVFPAFNYTGAGTGRGENDYQHGTLMRTRDKNRGIYFNSTQVKSWKTQVQNVFITKGLDSATITATLKTGSYYLTVNIFFSEFALTISLKPSFDGYVGVDYSFVGNLTERDQGNRQSFCINYGLKYKDGENIYAYNDLPASWTGRGTQDNLAFGHNMSAASIYKISDFDLPYLSKSAKNGQFNATYTTSATANNEYFVALIPKTQAITTLTLRDLAPKQGLIFTNASLMSENLEENKWTYTFSSSSGITSLMKVYVGDKGVPKGVYINSIEYNEGTRWNYDAYTQIVTITWLYSGASNITLNWNFPGDVNGDGIVTVLDLARFGKAYGNMQGQPNWDPDADINGDNIIDIKDLSIIGKNYGKAP